MVIICEQGGELPAFENCHSFMVIFGIFICSFGAGGRLCLIKKSEEVICLILNALTLQAGSLGFHHDSSTSWAIYLISLSFSSFVCKMTMTIPSAGEVVD